MIPHHTNSPILFAAILLLQYSTLCTSQPGNRTTSSSDSICETYGKCGAFGVCNSQETPICSCLTGFYPRNNGEWSSGNWSSGCVWRTPLKCDAGENRTNDDGFLRIQAMTWSDFTELWPGPESQCRGRCFSNCSCLAYGYGNHTGCRFWGYPLMDIHKSYGDSDSPFYIRVSSSELGKRKTIQSDGSVEMPPLQDALGEVNIQDLQFFKFEILANATDNFSNANKLGKGGFGPVYKGTLPNGREIAVKRLSQASGQGMQEFMNEVELISKLQHKNLVRLHGCCTESKEIMLIYEYMPNKSLDLFLFDLSQEILDWKKRFNIIEGICRGLLYLHRDSRLKIIHRDLKPSNILLDSNWNPKISDFGMARIFGTKRDHVSTMRVVGTLGYMAPEYAIDGRFSEKSDVFSLGVLILEIVIGKRNTSFIQQEGSFNLLGHVWKLWNEGDVSGVIDARISNLSYRDEVIRCIHIALLCVQEHHQDRPSVSTALSMLNSVIIKLPDPNKPAFSINASRHDAVSTSSSRQSQKSSSSMNNVTLSMIDGR